MREWVRTGALVAAVVGAVGVGSAAASAGCGGSSGAGPTDGGASDSTLGPDARTDGPASGDGGAGRDGMTGGDGATEGGGPNPNPQTCAEAAAYRSYIGCEFWPTVLASSVWSIFDFAVIVANVTAGTATVSVTGPNSVNQAVSVPPNQLVKIYLPWVPALKGTDGDSCGTVVPFPASVLAVKSAYHLVSSSPVSVYQFNALEYKGAGGPPGKDWSACPGLQVCAAGGTAFGCYSFTNDASLLIPTTAMTTTYRVTGDHGWTAANIGGVFAVTGTQDGTTVSVAVSPTGQIQAGGGIASTDAGATATFTLNAGDVAEIAGGPTDTSDLSGSLVTANKPVQVIAGVPCMDTPLGVAACDHLEQTVLPADAWGKTYVVTVPTGPHAAVIGHVVRLYGHVDGTHLTYSPPLPANDAGTGCPSTLNAGQVADCGIVSTDFEVRGDQPFAVGSFMLGGQLADPMGVIPNQEGDPSMSVSVPVEQYRQKYVFLAPDDYVENYVDIVAAPGAALRLDGVPVSQTIKPIGDGGLGVARVPLPGGPHELTSPTPASIQVIGYGSYTSYQYPGGMDLNKL